MYLLLDEELSPSAGAGAAKAETEFILSNFY